jgi:hypothetical protein
LSTKIDLDDLERIASAAQSTWWIRARDTQLWWIRARDTQMALGDGRLGSAGQLGPSNVDHIVANSPLVTLALIARIRELALEIGAQADGALEKGAVMP